MINTKQFRNIFYSYIMQRFCFPGDHSQREHRLLLLVLVHNGVHLLKPHIYVQNYLVYIE